MNEKQKKKAADEPVEFEKTLEELEALVERMESGELSLAESLTAFERGVALTRECQSALKDAELRVQTLMADGSSTEEDDEPA
ncbi:MAG: exodeoxyribonuclease VII small subunit [Pseudomonadaceae bacterium]|nr:exodeoxyribonuclease VII small subunit [Pseudomonadaceae bacterium]